jgi:hypothetical protein
MSIPSLPTGALSWDYDSKRVHFWLSRSDGALAPIDSWGTFRVQTERGPGSLGHLLALVEDEAADIEDQRVILTHAQIAALERMEVERLGLPPPAPYRLELRGSGLLTAPSFRFLHRLITPDGRPVLGVQRCGAFIRAGTLSYTLLDPIYSLLTGVEAFNDTPPSDLDARFLKWAELKEILPEDAVVEQHLRSMSIVRADAFTLDYDERGQVHPVPLSHTRASSQFAETQDLKGESLPPVAQASFSDRFQRLSKAQARYAMDGGWYLVLGQPLRRALEVVREIQTRPAEERRAFLNNPVGKLKERLGDELSEIAIEFVFEETPEYLSARVQGLGEWKPKLCAYVMPRASQWLPPEETILGVPVGDKVIEVAIKNVPELAHAVEAAIAQGQPEVVHNGQRILANQGTLEALYRLGGTRPQPPDTPDTPDTPEPRDPTIERLVPLIIDNLDEVGYSVAPRTSRGLAGGIPAVLRSAKLFRHQEQGLRWLQAHWAEGSKGALLADDMGLGKTLQTLGFLAWVQEQMEAGDCQRKPVLIVAPTGLLKNWEDEANMHLAPPGLGGLFRAYGNDMKSLASKTHREQIRTLTDADWVLTTYETLRDRIQLFIGIGWGIAVFDEAQKIKNPASRMSEMAKSIESDFTLALTGTPVENRLADIWSICDATNPGLLGSLKTFHAQYEKPAFQDPEAAAPLAKKLTEDAQPPIMLRRLKEDHLSGLPDKHEVLVEEEMPPAQAAAYAAVVGRASRAPGERGAMLQTLQNLRRVSLIAEGLTASGLADAAVQNSARLRATLQILDKIREKGEKALLFLEFLNLQEALLPYLQQRYGLRRPPLRISGSVSGDKRKQRVDEFQRSESGTFDIMILSPKAGGVGLTLTAANHVIHLTRWWNPAVEDQCTDRVYRIGQTRTVNVYLPLAIHPQFREHSFDRNLHLLLASKRRLSRSVLAPPSASEADIETLFANTVGNEIH